MAETVEVAAAAAAAARRRETALGTPPATRCMAMAAAWLISARLRPWHGAGTRVTVMWRSIARTPYAAQPAGVT
jgi:hypothetical protein